MKIFGTPKVGITEAQLLLRNLAVTLRAGVPLAKGLRTFEEDSPRNRKVLITHLRKRIEQGNTLADSMESAPKQFPPIAINLVRTGEMGGSLPESLEAVSTHLQKMLELKRKIRSAMMYPTFVLVAVLGLGISIGTLVLPKLIPLFETLDIELPWTTRLLLFVAHFLENYGIILGAVILVGMIGLYSITRMESFKPYWHRFMLYIPFIGNVQKQASAAQICASMGTLLGSGIPIRDAIPAAALSTENRVFRQALMDTAPVIESGRTFSEGLRQSGNIFPMMSKALVEVGEETGTLTETLSYLSDYFDAEVDYAVKNLTNALEPILLILVGLIVGGVVMAIITPIYDVTSSIR
jgi:type IV pilus assembly protein PilC